MTKPAFPQGGQRSWKSSNTGYKTPNYSKTNGLSERRNNAATKAQPSYQGGGGSKAAKTPGKSK